MAGLRDEQGNFLSQRTAEYPAQLATRFSNVVCHLFCPGSIEYPAEPCALAFALQAMPRKPRATPPSAAQDNGGYWRKTS